MDDLQNTSIQCPYCGEQIDVDVDCSVARQEYIEDCSVCCRPITISVTASPGNVDSIDVRSEDD
jgi:hypothetical protein